MASVRKHPSGWRVQIDRRGIRRSKLFPTKREAQDWAARQEAEILAGAGRGATTKFADVLNRYAREVSPTKRGERWEIIRIKAWALSDLAAKRIRDIGPPDITAWRDARLREVSPATVKREMNLLSAVFSKAALEWGMIDNNPCSPVRKPAAPPARDRLVTDDEVERLLLVAGDDLTTATARAVHAFRFACLTGMRAGEIVSLVWDRVDKDRRVARLDRTKNGSARDVPLSSAAVALLDALPGGDPVFGLTSRQLDALWRKMRDKAGVEGLTFHDARHRATTDLSKKLDVLSLAKMIGHRDIRQLQTYFNKPPEDIARRLD